MTPVEELRSAAVLLRQRAEAATPGPWRYDPDMLDNGALLSDSPDLDPGWGRLVSEEASGSADDLRWKATAHPLVGLALADLLNTIAEDMGRAGAVEDRAAGLDGQPMVVWVPGDLGPHEAWTAALRLARLITGGGS